MLFGASDCAKGVFDLFVELGRGLEEDEVAGDMGEENPGWEEIPIAEAGEGVIVGVLGEGCDESGGARGAAFCNAKH